MLALPIDTTAAHQEFEVTLDNVTCVLRLRWNSRDEVFRLDLYDSARAPVWLGQPVVVGWPLLRQCVLDGRPPGELVAFDTTGQGQEATLTVDSKGNVTHELGGRVQLYYLTEAEVAAAVAA